MLGHDRIFPSVLSSIRATVNSTDSSAPPTGILKASTPSASVFQTTASTSTTTPAFTTALPSSTAATTGLDQSAKIGIGVGISLGTLVVASLSFVAFRLYRKSKSRPTNIAGVEENTPESKPLEVDDVNTRIRLRHELADADPNSYSLWYPGWVPQYI